MKMQYDEVLNRITDFIKAEARTETIVGKPFKLGEFDAIPVIRVGIGFGTGVGEGEAEKTKAHGDIGGAGAGVGIEPIGFLVSRGSDINFLNVKINKGLSAAFEKVPDLIEKYMETRKPAEELAEV
jgi:uncharacterized spore protein YtfJ